MRIPTNDRLLGSAPNGWRVHGQVAQRAQHGPALLQRQRVIVCGGERTGGAVFEPSRQFAKLGEMRMQKRRTPCQQCVSRYLEPLLEPFLALLTAVRQGLEPRLPQLLLPGLLLLLLALLLRSKQAQNKQAGVIAKR